MNEFHDIIGVPYTGYGPKSQQQIAAETIGKPKERRNWKPPEGYKYGAKLNEWETSETTLSRDVFIRSVEPMHDRIVVRLLSDTELYGVRAQNRIVLTDARPLIGGMRKAEVLKTGPGKWVAGEWWSTLIESGTHKGGFANESYPYTIREWTWIPGYRRPVSVSPGQIVFIGNWVDLELEDIALCQEGDVRCCVQ